MSQFYRLEQEFLEAVAELKNWLIQPIALLGFHLYPQALLDNLEQAADSVVDRIVEPTFQCCSYVPRGKR